ncbi:exopolysaccharide production repressor protein [Rhizobium oryzicola]|uniref:Exopolysaccharide production repressor protein n=1 Tax=Rhizobium oryzicola TaxID=1232668 RepID=A0ABT8T0A1_9HYPH|nr:exopolysaccharide production repressor protein [Rhizobium oryzicola]MDO1584174.1 exopolysaccharide production repressor protein [Rhizobium oryzicola]
MYAPRALFSMLVVLVVFAISTYLLYGSFWSTVLQTILCAIILQVGYFLAVVFLVRREHALRQADPDDATAVSRSRETNRSEEAHPASAPSLKVGDR